MSEIRIADRRIGQGHPARYVHRHMSAHLADWHPAAHSAPVTIDLFLARRGLEASRMYVGLWPLLACN